MGEEGLDWAVKEVPGKGRGLVALRDLPYLFRVIVEGWQSPDQPGLEDHPGFKFLSDPPEGVKVPGADDSATAFERKFGWNGTGENKECADKLGFRIALVNHECDSNTAAEVDRDFGVMVRIKILYSLKLRYYMKIISIFLPFKDPVHFATGRGWRGNHHAVLRFQLVHCR